MKRQFIIVSGLALALAACGGSSNPPGSTVGFAPSPNPGATALTQQSVNVSVTVPAASQAGSVRRQYVSPNTQSVVLLLTSVNGTPVSGQQAATINTYAGAPNCTSGSHGLTCTGTVQGATGTDVFTITTYAQPNATGNVLSTGSFSESIGSGSTISINNTGSSSIAGVIASLTVTAVPPSFYIGTASRASLVVTATDASGAVIVGPGNYSSPITLSFANGSAAFGFVTSPTGTPQSTITLNAPTSTLAVAYNGDPNAPVGPIAVQAQTQGASGSISVNAVINVNPAPTPTPTPTPVGMTPTPPPTPPPGATIYVLNVGTTAGLNPGGTVTEYSSNATGNAAPIRTLTLNPALYPASIAVDASGNLYVGQYANGYGIDYGNEIDVYAPGASGIATPIRTIVGTSDQTTAILDPGVLTFDQSGNLLTLGQTTVNKQQGNEAVLYYPPGANGPATPTAAWNFSYKTGPTIVEYTGGQGYTSALVQDSSGNYYVAGALFRFLTQYPGIYATTSVANKGGLVPITRTIPADTTTTLPAPPNLISGLAVDGSGYIYAAQTTFGSGTAVNGAIDVFAPGATSGTTDTPPIRTITSTALNGQTINNGSLPALPMTLYSNELFLVNQQSNAILEFPTSASGSTTPTATISGPATGLNGPYAIAVSAAGSQVSAAHKRPENHPHP